jgi:hypothetical protein
MLRPAVVKPSLHLTLVTHVDVRCICSTTTAPGTPPSCLSLICSARSPRVTRNVVQRTGVVYRHAARERTRRKGMGHDDLRRAPHALCLSPLRTLSPPRDETTWVGITEDFRTEKWRLRISRMDCSQKTSGGAARRRRSRLREQVTPSIGE